MRNVEEVVVIGFHKAQRPQRQDRRGELGASLVEYALMVALIAVVCIGAIQYFGGSNKTGLNRSSSCIHAASNQQAMPTNC